MCSLAPGELVGRPVDAIDLVELDEEDATTVPARLGPDLADGRPQRLLLRRADGSTVAVSGTNLTKKFYYTYLGETLNSIGITDGQPGRPREFRISVRREF